MSPSAPQLIFIVVAIVAVGLLLLVGMILRGAKAHKLDKEYYQAHWLKIENGLLRDRPETYTLSIIEADKLLDRALRESGIAGETMGERLKHSGSRFSDLDHLWTSHRIRNQLVHEQDARINYQVARRALSSFRQALKDLEAI